MVTQCFSWSQFSMILHFFFRDIFLIYIYIYLFVHDGWCLWIISVAHIWADVVNLWCFHATREAPKNDAVISSRTENWGLYMTGQIAWFVCCFWSVHSPVALLICVWTLSMGPMAKVQLSTASASIPAISWPKVCQCLVRSSIWALLGIYD